MIEYGEEKYTPGIRECWKKCFTMSDPRLTEYFFHYIYKPEYGYVNVQENNVVSSLIRIPHVMMFNQRALATSMILGVSTLPEYRNHGAMHEVMNVAMDACSHRELITLLQTDRPQMFEQWGFEPVYYRSDYTITRNDVKRITNFGCAYEPSPIDMLKVYSAFISRFNGFIARDVDYFARYKREIAAQGGKIVAYYDAKNKIQGYASILLEGREARVEECIYLDSVALNKLLNAALQDRPTIHLHVSQAENLSVLFPDSNRHDYPYMYARLNDADLFSRLYNVEVKDVKEAFQVSNRPLAIREWL